MGRRSDLEILIDALRAQDDNQASPAKLSSLLGWEVEKVRVVAARGNDDESVPVYIAKGGVIKYRGSERGALVGIYYDVANVILRYWAEREERLRNVDVVVTAKSGRRGTGVWTHPDLVMAADPARRRSPDEPRRLHAIEVETADGFGLRSVYQAHAQGRGAAYSWVFGSKAPSVEKADWDRVLWTANELGIGLVTFEKPHVYSTWVTHFDAEERFPTDDEREAFLELTMNPEDRAALAL